MHCVIVFVIFVLCIVLSVYVFFCIVLYCIVYFSTTATVHIPTYS
jgi:hypothetical protein